MKDKSYKYYMLSVHVLFKTLFEYLLLVYRKKTQKSRKTSSSSQHCAVINFLQLGIRIVSVHLGRIERFVTQKLPNIDQVNIAI